MVLSALHVGYLCSEESWKIHGKYWRRKGSSVGSDASPNTVLSSWRFCNGQRSASSEWFSLAVRRCELVDMNFCIQFKYKAEAIGALKLQGP